MHRRLLQSFTYLLKWGRGTCTLTKHTRCWTYSALRYFFNSQQIGIFKNDPTFKDFCFKKWPSILK